MERFILVLTVPVAIVLIWWITTYNRGVRLRALIQEARSNIDVQLKRRHDLIPQIVEVVKGYAKHEQDLFARIATARTQAVQNLTDLKSGYEDEEPLVQATNRLVALIESYPEIKADKNFKALFDELTQTEDRIAAARRFYNGNVREWNTLIESIPSAWVVQGPPAYYFEEEGLKIVKVSF